MIRGKYAAVIEAEFHVDETLPGVLPWEKISKVFTSDRITQEIHKCVMSELFDSETTTLKITPATYYMYKEGDTIEQRSDQPQLGD